MNNFLEQDVSLEKCPALVLNADYRPLSYYPLSLWSWQDTVKSVFLDRVIIVSNYDRVVRSPSFDMQGPVCLGRIKSGLVEFLRLNHQFCDELIQKVYSRKNTDRFVPFKVSWSFIFRTDSRPGIGTKNKIGIHFIHQRIAEIQKFTVTKKIEGIDPSKRVGKRF